jgi:hypothetical protein
VLSASFQLAAQTDAAVPQAAVINPKPGVWANKQALVVDVPSGCDVFYSIEGNDPLIWGFAYDGPVMIDAEGEITLNLATVAADNSSVKQTVKYTVDAAETPVPLEACLNGAVFNLTAGVKIELPRAFLYCLGNETTPKFEGRSLALSAFYPSRYVPCTVSDGERLWRFVISVKVPHNAASSSSDGQGKGAAELPKFDLAQTGVGYAFRAYFSDDRTARNEGYTFTAPEAGILDPAREIPVDALFGEEIESVITINAYRSGVFQGAVQVPYLLDRRPPDAPVIESAASAFNRRPVSVTISQSPVTNNEGDSVFFAVESSPPDDSVFENRSLDAQNFPAEPKQDTIFSRYHGGEIALKADENSRAGASVITVFAFTEDASGNRSGYAVSRVLIDTLNYYLAPPAEDSSGKIPDGSITNPFTSFDQAIAAVSRTSGARLHIQGEWTTQESLVISAPCLIFGNGKTRVKFDGGAQLIVKNAPFSAQSIIFEKIARLDSEYLTPVVALDNADAQFKSCTFAVSAQGNKTLFSAAKSTLGLDTCLLSLTVTGYGIAVAGNGSNVSARDSTIVLNASTALGFSLEGGTFTLSNSRVRAIAPLSRAAELSDSTFSIAGNIFAVDSDAPVWYDRASVPAVYINNARGDF